MKIFGTILALVVLAVVVGLIFVYSGAYPLGADVPHSAGVRWLVSTVSDRSVASHARSVQVPPELSAPDSTMILRGAGQYAAMCSGCHLAPGYDSDEISKGLYPRAPRFARGTDLSTAELFWVTKHGIKDTGMPAWGATHSDQELWTIVAFVRRLGTMSPEQYRSIVQRAPRDEDMTRLPMPGGGAAGQGAPQGGGG